MIDVQEKLCEQAGRPKLEVSGAPDRSRLAARVRELAEARLDEAVRIRTKEERYAAIAEDVEATPGFGTPSGYPFEGDVDGTTFTHPDYNPAAFYLYDLGVVILDEPVHFDEYGALPELGVVDTLKGADKKGALTAVGYGQIGRAHV